MSKISELKVMKSNAGFYIGKSIYDDYMKMDLPYSRNSIEYYGTKEEAQIALQTKSYTERNY